MTQAQLMRENALRCRDIAKQISDQNVRDALLKDAAKLEEAARMLEDNAHLPID